MVIKEIYERDFGLVLDQAEEQSLSSYIFDKITISHERPTDGKFLSTNKVREKYVTNLSRHCSYSQYTPKYISLEEYKAIIGLIKESKSRFKERNILIINLMYQRGLRLGEVLGLTIEDINAHPDNAAAGRIYLRNRLSDSKYQNAKSPINVYSKETYKNKNYHKEGIGYEISELPPPLMNQLNEYLNCSRNIFSLSKKVKENIIIGSKADSIFTDNRENFYLILNKNGLPLSSSGWSKYIKEIFLELGINIDKDY